jgi:alpha,alpha-trehalose phosphorylase
MGGTWMAIVFGFAGLRVKESGLSLSPSLPDEWTSLQFQLQYQNRTLRVHIEKDAVTYLILEGEDLAITHNGEEISLVEGKEVRAV